MEIYRPIKKPILLIWIVWSLLAYRCLAVSDFALAKSPGNGDSSESPGWLEKMDMDFGGHLKSRGMFSWQSSRSPFTAVSDRLHANGNLEGRLKSDLYFGENAKLEVHYELILSGGDTRKASRKLSEDYPNLSDKAFAFDAPNDDRRLFDLTSVASDRDDHVLYHRIDRFVLTLTRDWGTVRIGRQAVTWGNGMLFNPMDLFNPFSPTDIERDYKMGDDMIAAQLPLPNSSELQLLSVPRRNPKTREIRWDHGSLAAKYHFIKGMTEYDIMAAKHYKDMVLGMGGVGYLGNTAWRLNGTWTITHRDTTAPDYLSIVANMDYSWIWWEKNFYGFLEFFYSGIGKDDYTDAAGDPAIVERLDRGELFTLGKTYLGGHIRVELHPLVNVFLTAIANLRDPSGLFQPRMTYDISQNTQILLGGNIPWGKQNTEFGGYPIPGTPFTTRQANTAFLWISYFF